MKPGIQKRFAFIGKSLLWSILLYAVFMLVINWDEVNNTVHGRTTTTIINVSPTGEKQITDTHSNTHGNGGVMKNIVSVLRTISGFAR